MRLSRTGQALTGCKLRERNWRKQKDKKKKKEGEGWWYSYGHEVFIELIPPWSRDS